MQGPRAHSPAERYEYLMSLFDMFFDSEWRQRQDINLNTEHVRWVDQQERELEAQIHQLRTIVRDELQQLRAAVIALSGVLGERGLCDRQDLDRRYREAYEQLTPPPAPAPSRVAPPTSADPYRDSAAPPAPEPLLTCVMCHRTVPRSRTNMTVDGAQCDACFRP